MDLPRSDHATAFRAHVTPRLREMVISRSILFWTEDRSAGDIADEVWLEAVRLGAGRLPDEHQEALRDWLYAFLTEQINVAEKVREEAEALAVSLLREPSREVIRTKVREFLGVG